MEIVRFSGVFRVYRGSDYTFAHICSKRMKSAFENTELREKLWLEPSGICATHYKSRPLLTHVGVGGAVSFGHSELYRAVPRTCYVKVVGFRNRHIGSLLIRQNIRLTVIGICIGLPAGVGLAFLLAVLAWEYELKMVVGALTYCIRILLTFGVSLIIGFVVAR